MLKPNAGRALSALGATLLLVSLAVLLGIRGFGRLGVRHDR